MNVATAVGQKFSARFAIVSVPIGVLKSSIGSTSQPSIAFRPALGEHKRRALETIGAGRAIRVALAFPYIFWGDENNLEGAESLVLEGAVYGIKGFGRGEHLEFTNMAFYSPGVPVLLAEADGDYGERLGSFSDDEVGNELWKRLAVVYGPGSPRPIRVVVQRFSKHESFTQGAFSYTAVGAMCAEDRLDLESPHGPHGNVLFAGEHTSPLMPGTISGAFMSGLQAATRVACSMGISRPSRHILPELFVDNWKPECVAAFGHSTEDGVIPRNIDLCNATLWEIYESCRTDGSDSVFNKGVWTPIH